MLEPRLINIMIILVIIIENFKVVIIVRKLIVKLLLRMLAHFGRNKRLREQEKQFLLELICQRRSNEQNIAVHEIVLEVKFGKNLANENLQRELEMQLLVQVDVLDFDEEVNLVRVEVVLGG